MELAAEALDKLRPHIVRGRTWFPGELLPIPASEPYDWMIAPGLPVMSIEAEPGDFVEIAMRFEWWENDANLALSLAIVDANLSVLRFVEVESLNSRITDFAMSWAAPDSHRNWTYIPRPEDVHDSKLHLAVVVRCITPTPIGGVEPNFWAAPDWPFEWTLINLRKPASAIFVNELGQESNTPWPR